MSQKCHKNANLTACHKHRGVHSVYDLLSPGRMGRKKLGGWKEICPTFSDFSRVVKNIFRRDFPKLLSTRGGGGGGGEE